MPTGIYNSLARFILVTLLLGRLGKEFIIAQDNQVNFKTRIWIKIPPIPVQYLYLLWTSSSRQLLQPKLECSNQMFSLENLCQLLKFQLEGWIFEPHIPYHQAHFRKRKEHGWNVQKNILYYCELTEIMVFFWRREFKTSPKFVCGFSNVLPNVLAVLVMIIQSYPCKEIMDSSSIAYLTSLTWTANCCASTSLLVPNVCRWPVIALVTSTRWVKPKGNKKCVSTRY